MVAKKETPVFIKRMKVREKEHVEVFSKMLSFITETDLCNPNTKVLEILDRWIDTKKRSLYIIYERKELELRFLGNAAGGRREEELEERGRGGGEARVREGGRGKAGEAEDEHEEIKEKKLGAMEAVNIILCLTRTLKNLEETNDLKKLDWDFVGKVSLMSIFESQKDGFFFDLYNFEIVPHKDKQPFIFSYISLIKELNATLKNPLLTILRKGIKEKNDWTFVFSFPLFSFEKRNLSKQWSTYYQKNKKYLHDKENNKERIKKEEEKQKDLDENNRLMEEERKRNERNDKKKIESTIKKATGGKEEAFIKEEIRSRRDEKEEWLTKRPHVIDDNFDGERTTMVLKKNSSYNFGGENKNFISKALPKNRSYKEAEEEHKREELERRKEKEPIRKNNEQKEEERSKNMKEKGREEEKERKKKGGEREKELVSEEGVKKRKDEGIIYDQSMEKDDIKKKKKEEGGKLEEKAKDGKEERRKKGKEGGSEREKEDEEEKELEKKARKLELKSKTNELQTLIEEIKKNKKKEEMFIHLNDYCEVCKDLLTNYKSKEFKKWGEDFKSKLTMGLRVATLLLMEKKNRGER